MDIDDSNLSVTNGNVNELVLANDAGESNSDCVKEGFAHQYTSAITHWEIGVGWTINDGELVNDEIKFFNFVVGEVCFLNTEDINSVGVCPCIEDFGFVGTEFGDIDGGDVEVPVLTEE